MKKTKSTDRERDDIAKFNLRRKAEAQKRLLQQKNELQDSLKELMSKITAKSLSDTDIGVDKSATEFINRLEKNPLLRMFNEKIRPFVPHPTDPPNVSTGREEYRLRNLIVASRERSPSQRFISLSDTYHIYYVTKWELKLYFRESPNNLEERKGIVAYIMGKGHDLAKNSEARKYVENKGIDWLHDQDVRKWLRDSYQDPPKSLSDERVHQFVSAQLLEILCKSLGLTTQEMHEIRDALYTHDSAWQTIKGEPCFGKPQYVSGKCLHDSDKLVRIDECLVETPLYALREGTPLYEMEVIARKHATIFTSGGFFLLPYLNKPEFLRKLRTNSERSFSYLDTGLKIENINALLRSGRYS